MIEVRLDMPLMSKARPRVARGRAYMPAPYVNWKKTAQVQLESLWTENDLPTYDKETPIKLSVQAHGPGRCDSDNLLGALLDAGLPVKQGWRGCWVDDRVTVIPWVCFEWVKNSEQFWVLQINQV
ncbi:predicted protein [Cyanophage PSS2]|uniref:hypothetical protein n=1 Tax=Cyanophage PSS2 TaxID=658401 RepID=UPI0001B0404E|nr:hypothetical protein PSS2_gp119 [Cyanophage PSS2]YP_003084265.1 hypothetical protein PSS2_gp121 [Cyanophage PSS2]ACT65681.1 hypothetical protein [Cyanophage PSS2]ACT65683.1 hypothetical protein [Cyanophage PSS2]ACY75819.1 predicted protein [Cyanophage PSS2]